MLAKSVKLWLYSADPGYIAHSTWHLGRSIPNLVRRRTAVDMPARSRYEGQGQVIKPHRVTPGDLLFLVRFRHRRLRRRLHHRRSANTFQLFGETPEANFFKPYIVNLWVWEYILSLSPVTFGQGH